MQCWQGVLFLCVKCGVAVVGACECAHSRLGGGGGVVCVCVYCDSCLCVHCGLVKGAVCLCVAGLVRGLLWCLHTPYAHHAAA